MNKDNMKQLAVQIETESAWYVERSRHVEKADKDLADRLTDISARAKATAKYILSRLNEK